MKTSVYLTGIPTIRQQALIDVRLKAKRELESLIAQCQRELASIDRFDDNRMLVATADLRTHFDFVMDAADDLEHAFNMAEVDEDGE